jgi:hypothetical protein
MVSFGLPQQKLPMSKSRFFTGQPVFSQVLKLIPSILLAELCQSHKTNRYCKRFKGYDHVVTMLYSAFHRCNSLNEIITGMQANGSRLLHLGLTQTPRRSTLADANKRTSEAFFCDLFHRLQKHYYGFLPDSRTNNKRKKEESNELFIIDSTSITLFSDVMQGPGVRGLNGKKKGGVKAHAVVHARHDVPCYVRLTEAKSSDRTFLKEIDFLPKGSIVAMDKGYNLYQKYSEWTERGIKWVTRLNIRAVYSINQKLKVAQTWREQGVRKDYIINLGNPDTSYINPVQKVRLIIFYDHLKKRLFHFISNDLTSEPLYICQLYKKRWQIETLFKRLKSNFSFKYFLGETPNAIKIQIWAALIADLLIKIVQDQINKLKNKKWAFANLASLIRLHLSTYIDLFAFLQNPRQALLHYQPPDSKKQATLF